MADVNEEREILLPEDDDQQVLDSPSESHELEVSKHIAENSQGMCTMSHNIVLVKSNHSRAS
jgi:hypothetical protein